MVTLGHKRQVYTWLQVSSLSLCVHPSPALVQWSWLSGSQGWSPQLSWHTANVADHQKPLGSDILGWGPRPLPPPWHLSLSVTSTSSVRMTGSRDLELPFLSEPAIRTPNTGQWQSEISKYSWNFYKILLRDNWKMCLELDFVVLPSIPRISKPWLSRNLPAQSSRCCAD